MASPSFEPGRPTETEILLSRLLEKTLRRSSALDTESLCLIAAKKVWSIRADVHVLSHDGNLVDASCLAVLAALRHFRRPDTSTEGEEVVVYTPAERTPVPLSILHYPFCLTFSTYLHDPDNEIVLLDACLLEEQLRDGSVTVSMNRHGEVCQVAKLGGVALDAISLLNCISVASERVKDLDKLVSQRLKEDEARREGKTKGLLSAENAR
jgi:exosome complex component RRP45